MIWVLWMKVQWWRRSSSKLCPILKIYSAYLSACKPSKGNISKTHWKNIIWSPSHSRWTWVFWLYIYLFLFLLLPVEVQGPTPHTHLSRDVLWCLSPHLPGPAGSEANPPFRAKSPSSSDKITSFVICHIQTTLIRSGGFYDGWFRFQTI